MVTEGQAPPSSSTSSPERRSNGAGGNLPVYRLLLRTLHAHGLEATASCLRREAGLTDDALLDNSSTSGLSRGLADSPEVVPGSQEMLLHRCRAARAAQRDTRQRVERCTEEMMAQQRRLESLKASIRSLRDQAEPPTVELQGARLRAQECQIQLLQTECAEYVQLEDTLREQLVRKEEEVNDLRRKLDSTQSSENDLRAALAHAQVENDKLRHSSPPQPPPVQQRPPEPRTEKTVLRDVLLAWDTPGGPRYAAQRWFAEVDANHDGRLEWNPGEIRNFVRAIFTHLGVHIPPWPEHIWYEMYRASDVNHSYSLDLDEALNFARHCAEAALQSMEGGNSPQAQASHPPVTEEESWLRRGHPQGSPPQPTAQNYAAVPTRMYQPQQQQQIVPSHSQVGTYIMAPPQMH